MTPSYVGQRVEIETAGLDESVSRSRPQRQLATVIAVHQKGSKCTVDVQLFNEVTRSYNGQVLTRLHVLDTMCRQYNEFGLPNPYHPRMALMQDLARCIPCPDDDESDLMSDSDDVSDAISDSASDGTIEGECEVTDADAAKENAGPNRPAPSWIRKISESCKTTCPEHRARLADPRRRFPGVCVSISDASGPQLYRAPGFPVCERRGQPGLCDCLDTSHFDTHDHPPDKWDGPHPYIAVAEAEAAGKDMTDVRQLLGRLESAHDHHLLYPDADETGDLSAEDFVSRATHMVCVDALQSGHPAGVWAAQQEVRYAGGEPCVISQELQQIHEQLVKLASANAVAVAQKQRPALEAPKPKPLDDTQEKQPKLLRVADRMRLWPGRNPRQRSSELPKKLDDGWRQAVITFRQYRASRGWSVEVVK